MTSTRRRAALAVAVLLLSAPAAWPDGGVVRSRETRGGLVVTVFTAPDPLRAGPQDVSVLVQDPSGTPVLHAEVTRDLIDVPAYTPEEGARFLADYRDNLDAIAAYCNQIGAVPILVVPAGNEPSLRRASI